MQVALKFFLEKLSSLNVTKQRFYRNVIEFIYKIGRATLNMLQQSEI